jgi:hypothetical protein
MKKSSPSLSIKEMQIKITLGFHFTPIRIAIIKNTQNNKFWGGCGEKGTSYITGGNVSVQPLWKTMCRLFKNLNVNLPYDPAIPLLGIHPKECD